jgi:acetyl-CoA C-acetyltransferase
MGRTLRRRTAPRLSLRPQLLNTCVTAQLVYSYVEGDNQMKHDDTDPVIVAGARTPIGKLMGALATLRAADLGAHAIAAALQRSGIRPAEVDYVIMGQVLTAGAGQNPARQAALAAGVPPTVPAITVNKVCLSGIAAIGHAAQLIRSGDCDVVIAGGQESMTQAPHLLPQSRHGFRYGEVALIDHLEYDGLHDVATDQSMGTLTESRNLSCEKISRADQDDFAAASHQRAANAAKNGIFDTEISPVAISQRNGDPIEVRDDEGVRADTTAESLSKLRPAFEPNGTITAASASQISDGAAALVITSKAKATELGLTWLAELGPYGMAAGPDSTLQTQPAAAIEVACRKADIAPDALDLYEINEAFAAVALASTRKLGLDHAKVNVNGGAIAIGHPLGMSGARIVLHLAHELGRRGGGTGAAALCGGGGQGDALLIHACGSPRPHAREGHRNSLQ